MNSYVLLAVSLLALFLSVYGSIKTCVGKLSIMYPIMAVMGQVLGVIVLWIILNGLNHAA